MQLEKFRYRGMKNPAKKNIAGLLAACIASACGGYLAAQQQQMTQSLPLVTRVTEVAAEPLATLSSTSASDKRPSQTPIVESSQFLTLKRRLADLQQAYDRQASLDNSCRNDETGPIFGAELTSADEAAVAKQAAAYELVLAEQTKDPEFSGQLVAEIDELLSEQDTDATRLVDVGCGETFCKMEFSHDTRRALATFIRKMPLMLESRGDVFIQVDDFQTDATTLVYLSKTGFSLPDIDS